MTEHTQATDAAGAAGGHPLPATAAPVGTRGWRALRASSRWTFRDAGWFRWRLWGWACDFLPRGCPANLHSLIVSGYLKDPRIDWKCHQDCQANGGCWCGKLGPDGKVR